MAYRQVELEDAIPIVLGLNAYGKGFNQQQKAFSSASEYSSHKMHSWAHTVCFLLEIQSIVNSS